MTKFWNWKNNVETEERELTLNGVIASESWLDDEIDPQMFKAELEAGEGDIRVCINSPGGDCLAAAQIYNMLKAYKGKVTVFIDSLAASAASVIAMAGDEVVISPVGLIMIHNPSTIAWGESKDLKHEAKVLDEFKETIVNAYELKTKLTRSKLAKLMDDETWLSAEKALELGFADRISEDFNRENPIDLTEAFSKVAITRRAAANALMAKIKQSRVKEDNNKNENQKTVKAEALMSRLNLLKNWR